MEERKRLVNKGKPMTGVIERPTRIDPLAEESVRQHTCVHACTQPRPRIGSIGEVGAEYFARTASGYICPSLRSVSIPRPSSCARPARSAVVVLRNSMMTCGIVFAQEFTVPVQGTQPRLR